MNSPDRGLQFVEPEPFEFDDHQRQKRERWLATYSPQALQQGLSVDGRVVKHLHFEHLIGTLDRMYLLGHEFNQPMGCIISGPAGTGKSTLCRYFMDTLPKHDLVTRGAGVIYIRTRLGSSLGSSVQQILKQLKYPLFKVSSSTIDAKRSLAIEALRRHKTRLLLVDEAHHLLSQRSSRHGHGTPTSEFFREVMDDAKVGLCLVGGPALADLKQVDSYLYSRCSSIEVLGDFKLEKGWLSLAQSLLPSNERLDFKGLQSSQAGQQALHKTANGNLRRLKQFLTELTMLTVDSGQKSPDKALLRRAYGSAFGSEALPTCPWV